MQQENKKMYFKQDIRPQVEQDRFLEPLVEDLYAVIEKHCGDPTSYHKLDGNHHKIHFATMAALIIWAAMASKCNKVKASNKIGINRNTLHMHMKNNKYIEPVKDLIFDKDNIFMDVLKCRMGLNKNG
jgi:hypothetical protein